MLYLLWFPKFVIAILNVGVIFTLLAHYSLSTTLGLETMSKPTYNSILLLWVNNLILENKRFFSLYNSEESRHMLNLLRTKKTLLNLIYHGLG